ncbi:MAG: dephospho-CoA kinase [Burkholderiales bacterium]|nr:dephospho-CoA kinase [Burkholderiales bacterium]MDE2452037.1 dephospho-CoA kinase [Burkholderiales bacterium]
MAGLGLKRAPRIGLTGGIGSGKSTVAQWLAAAGAVVVDSDAISRALTAPGGAALPLLRQTFGDGLFTAAGALDRERLRSLVFADAGAKARLEGVLHPMIGAETERQASAARDAVVVFDVPLLAESRRWRERVDRVLVVDCSEDTQAARVRARSGWSEEAVRSVIAQQATRVARRAIADAVIFNEGIGREELQRHVMDLWAVWNNRAP